MKPAIIFDFDGTIADSFQYVYGFLCREAGKPADWDAAAAMQYRGISMKAMALKLGIPFWRLPLVYFKGRRSMRQNLMEVAPFAGMPELIRLLHADGNQLFIVSSNSARNVKTFLRTYQLEQCFVGIRGGAGIMGKVSIIRQLLVRYRLRRSQCRYVGDEIGDMVAAKAVGIRAIAVSWGFADAKLLAAAADDCANNTAMLAELLH